jgi:hypothetical protein
MELASDLAFLIRHNARQGPEKGLSLLSGVLFSNSSPRRHGLGQARDTAGDRGHEGRSDAIADGHEYSMCGGRLDATVAN